jgi:hypothetical protein
VFLATEAQLPYEYLRRDFNPLDECAARRTGTGVSPVNKALESTGETPVLQDVEAEVERLLREENEAIIRANADQETLYDQPEVVRSKVRVSGPFTVEAIPPPSLEAMEETPIGGEPASAVGGVSMKRSAVGETSGK